MCFLQAVLNLHGFPFVRFQLMLDLVHRVHLPVQFVSPIILVHNSDFTATPQLVSVRTITLYTRTFTAVTDAPAAAPTVFPAFESSPPSTVIP